jgi:hypothetical protein
MDYLTQHYKNLSEQLQAKVNHLKQLIEAENTPYSDRFETEEDQYIRDQENIQKSKVKVAKTQPNQRTVAEELPNAIALGGIGTLGAGLASAVVPPLAPLVGAGALLGGAVYGGAKATERAMNYFDPEQKTYAKIGSVLTGGPENVDRTGPRATRAQYDDAAIKAAAARKARYGTESGY